MRTCHQALHPSPWQGLWRLSNRTARLVRLLRAEETAPDPQKTVGASKLDETAIAGFQMSEPFLMKRWPTMCTSPTASWAIRKSKESLLTSVKLFEDYRAFNTCVVVTCCFKVDDLK